MGVWKPRYVIWENVKNVRSKYMVHNHNRYMSEMAKMGYTSSYELLDARDFGLPQARQRYFTVSVLGTEYFDFSDLIHTPMRNIKNFLETDVPDYYVVTQPSMLRRIDGLSDYDGSFKGRVPVIRDYAMTITCKQMRSPNSGVVDIGNGKYRYLTERECWRIQGYTDEDFENAKRVHPGKENCLNGALYKQAGNSIPVPIFESLFRKIILGETEKIEDQTGQLRFA